jgi:hypothetical protein
LAPRSRYIGSSLGDLLRQEGIFEEAEGEAVKELIAWQLAAAMKQQSPSKAREP